MVVDKPAGLLTAPTPESDRNNLASLLERRESNGPRILVVHRIDLETSGLIVFAKTPDANRALSERFQAHDLERAYLAVVAGSFPDELAVIDKPVNGRPSGHPRRGPGAVRDPRPRWSPAAWRPAAPTRSACTCWAAGHPVIGDDRYGGPVFASRAADGAARHHPRLRSPSLGRAAVVHQPLAQPI